MSVSEIEESKIKKLTLVSFPDQMYGEYYLPVEIEENIARFNPKLYLVSRQIGEELLNNRSKVTAKFVREEVDDDGTVRFFLGRKLHRDNDEPAVIYTDGTKEWFVDGKRHRVGGPAILSPYGRVEEWWFNGNLHRTDGPAVSYLNGEIEKWFLNGKLHRADGPAVSRDGQQEWWFNDKLHRESDSSGSVGPAVIYSTGVQEWWFNGELYKTVTPDIFLPEDEWEFI